MIGAWLAAAWAAPVLEPEPDPLARCAADADAVGGTLADPGPLPPSDKVAVVIGVPCHRKAGVPALAYATRDAVRVGEALRAGGFAVVPLLTVVDEAQVLQALDRARAALRPDGTLVVYFSGHGVLREANGRISRYLVLSDTDLGEIETTALAVRDLDWRVGAIPAAHRVIVQDTCFASRSGGALGAEEAGGKGIGALEPPVPLQDGDLRLYASRFFEQAVESPALEGSVYTAHLLEGLTDAEADLDGDGCVGLLEAHAWAASRTEAERQGFQVPQILARRPENLVLGCVPGPATHGVVVPPSEGQLTMLDRAGTPVGGARLDPGTYRIEVDRPADVGHEVVLRPILDHRFAVGPGRWLDLDAELDRRAPLGALELEAGWAPVPIALHVPIGATLGLAAWAAPRDRGFGRPVLGFAARTGVGGSVGGYRVRDGEAGVDLGWTWSAAGGAVGVGPGIELGGLLQSTRFGEEVTVAPGSYGELGVRGGLLAGPLAGTLWVGARAIAVAGAPPAVGPVVRIGFGPRL